jgi:hypothetical protein
MDNYFATNQPQYFPNYKYFNKATTPSLSDSALKPDAIILTSKESNIPQQTSSYHVALVCEFKRGVVYTNSQEGQLIAYLEAIL